MPYDSQGNFHRIHNWEQDRLDDVEIVSDRHDEEDNNFAEGLSQCFLRDGRTTLGGNMNTGNHKIQNLANGSASKDAVNKGQMDSAISSARTTITTNYQNYVENVLSQIYPVGSIYIGTQSTCPMASIITGSTWSLVSKGRALWGGNGTAGSGTTDPSNYNNAPANTTITAGLPNITGTFIANKDWKGMETSGAFTGTAVSSSVPGGLNGGDVAKYTLDASRSSSIYGKSSTVQPYAYVVNVWRRTA